jgi:enterochelin esterase-like enzyme
MKKILFTLFIFTFQYHTFAQSTGKVLESISFLSKTLKKEAKYSIYLPPDYDKNERKYPVVYLLHGYTGNETDWIQQGEAPTLIDRAIANGTIPPMIVIMPDGQNSWYVNSPTTNWNYEDFFIKEFIPRMDSMYRTRAKKDSRALAGLSMGGYGSFMYAMKYPTLFGSCAMLSAAFFSDTGFQERGDMTAKFFEPVYGKEANKTEAWKANSPFYFLKKENVEAYNSVKIYFDCGDDDFVMPSHLELDLLLRKLKINHELRIREGVHNWRYWREGLIPALQFCGDAFIH